MAAAETQPDTEPQQHHYSVLEQMVAEVSQDHAHLRTFIYEYARTKLRKELYPQFLDGAWSEIEEQMRGLEDAIDRLETEYERTTPLPPHSKPRLVHGDKANGAKRINGCALRHRRHNTIWGWRYKSSIAA